MPSVPGTDLASGQCWAGRRWRVTPSACRQGRRRWWDSAHRPFELSTRSYPCARPSPSLVAALALFACVSGDNREPVAPDGVLLAHTPRPAYPTLLSIANARDFVGDLRRDTFTPLVRCHRGRRPRRNHRTLRITVNTPNIGKGDLFVGDPNVHIDPNGDGDISDSDGLFEVATCHQHFHFRHYATYELFPVNANGSLGNVIISAKRGFCMIDVAPYNTPGGQQPTSWVYRSCGRIGVAGNQGISVGWADQYYKWLKAVLRHDPADVPRVRTDPHLCNPPFTRSRASLPGERCTGLPSVRREQLLENIAEIRITTQSHRERPATAGGGQNLRRTSTRRR